MKHAQYEARLQRQVLPCLAYCRRRGDEIYEYMMMTGKWEDLQKTLAEPLTVRRENK